MKEILSVGYQLPTNEDDYISIDSQKSLSDADLVIFCPDFKDTFDDYNENNYRGKRSYNLNTSTRIVDSIKHWRKELGSYLKSGRNLFVLLKYKDEFYIDSGQRQTSGTGRNQKVTNLVELQNNYKALPFELEVHNSNGKKIVCQNELIKPFFKTFEKDLTFEAYIESQESYTELLKTKTLDKLLSISFKMEEGNVIILPYLDNDKDEFYEKDGEWTNKAIIFGKKLLTGIIEIDKQISSNVEKTVKPDWLNDKELSLKKAEITQELLGNVNSSIKELEQEKERLEIVFKNDEIYKDLLFETGKPLEIAVIKALEIIGYTAANFDDGVLELDQVITSPENVRYIGECEGKDSKSIDIGKFRQLQDSLNEDFERAEVEEKAFGLLFGNPHRLIQIEKRKEFFTQKCIKGAEREKIGLIKTIDLFFICQYLTANDNNDFKIECRKSIQDGLGSIINFPKIPIK
ncbi:hypothetical protein FLSI110296_03740 [Flavobacterium sinopsychrotolerans]|uniref:Uncharacterized protein n=1 Tax=Flavobacterium sinopsychrotolerans TaxID=604089 RepID=A0A1H8JI33_9FLAO|nr:hypothetical protein [Flavobacterium sinopsychrotolerans]SEN79877.1 hypothetical protein SAMN04487942_1000 [Flavobacterium sinopsychrotolerans]